MCRDVIIMCFTGTQPHIFVCTVTNKMKTCKERTCEDGDVFGLRSDEALHRHRSNGDRQEALGLKVRALLHDDRADANRAGVTLRTVCTLQTDRVTS